MGAISMMAMMGVLAVQEVKWIGEPPIGHNLFGYDVALRGNVALVGEPGNNNGEAGKTTIFTAPGGDWTVAARTVLVCPNPTKFSFGSAVALGDTCAMVGAPPDSEDGEMEKNGVVYEYSLSNNVWTYSGRSIEASGTDDGFGAAVAVSPDCQRTIIGAYERTINGIAGAGAAEVHERNGPGWQPVASLTQPAQGMKNWFGYSVAIAPGGGAVAVGTIYVSGLPGRAYVFSEDDGWSDPVILKGESAKQDGFGRSVAISADGTVVVGANLEDNPMNNDSDDDQSGAVYVFSAVLQGDPQFVRLPITGSLGGGDNLGADVAIEDDLIVAGATLGDSANMNDQTGAVWVYYRTGDTWMVKDSLLSASDGEPSDGLGFSVALSGQTVLAGAYGSSPPNLIQAGAAYAFTFAKKKGEPCGAPDDCPTGFCVDGYCCESACGEGMSDDCIVCDASPGTCTPEESEMCAPGTTGDTMGSSTGGSSEGTTGGLTDDTGSSTGGPTEALTGDLTADTTSDAAGESTSTPTEVTADGPSTTNDATSAGECNGGPCPTLGSCDCSSSAPLDAGGVLFAFGPLLLFRLRARGARRCSP